MTSFNRLTVWLAPLLLLASTQLFATPPSHAAKLKTELEKLQSETLAIKEQAQADQTRIERLKRKIEFLKIQNKALDQRVRKEIQQYKSEADTAPE